MERRENMEGLSLEQKRDLYRDGGSSRQVLFLRTVGPLGTRHWVFSPARAAGCARRSTSREAGRQTMRRPGLDLFMCVCVCVPCMSMCVREGRHTNCSGTQGSLYSRAVADCLASSAFTTPAMPSHSSHIFAMWCSDVSNGSTRSSYCSHSPLGSRGPGDLTNRSRTPWADVLCSFRSTFVQTSGSHRNFLHVISAPSCDHVIVISVCIYTAVYSQTLTARSIYKQFNICMYHPSTQCIYCHPDCIVSIMWM